MKSKILYILGGLSLLTVASCNNNYGSYNEVQTPVKVKSITKSSIVETVNTTGTALATNSAEIKSEANGDYKLNINPRTGKQYRLGDKVKKGTVIVSLINKEFENNNQLESKKLNLEIAENELKAQKRLYEKGGVTLKEVNNSKSAFINAKYSYENAIIGANKLKVIAPFDGVIVDLPYYTSSSKITTGTKLVQIMNYTKMYMPVKLSEKSIENIKVGNEIYVTNYTIKDDTLNGKVSQISPAVDPNTRTFNGYIEIHNPDRLLRPGMFVKASIITKRSNNTIVIPKEIVRYNGKKASVFIIDRNRAKEVNIKTGIETEKTIEVIKGLEENQRIIISGYEMLNNYSKVKVIL